MNDKDREELKELFLGSGFVGKRECESKSDKIMSKLDAVHTDVQDTNKKINGHINWHDGIMHEEQSQTAIKSLKYRQWSAIGKWLALVFAVLMAIFGAVYSYAKAQTDEDDLVRIVQKVLDDKKGVTE